MSETETVLIKLPKALKKQLKFKSVEQERTMSEIVEELLIKYFNEQ